MTNLTSLSFVKPRADGTFELWAPEPCASYAKACYRGRSRANELIVFMRAHNRPDVLGTIVAAIAARGEFGGIEIGFFQQLGEALNA